MRDAALMIASQRDDFTSSLLARGFARLAAWAARWRRAFATRFARRRERSDAGRAFAAIARAGDHRLADLGLIPGDFPPVDLDVVPGVRRGRWGEPG